MADAASGPAFCAAAGVLQRAAFGPREVVSLKALAGVKTSQSRDGSSTPFARAASWLRDNL